MMTLSKSCLPSNNGCTPKSTAKHKILDENENEANLSDRGINSMEELPRICKDHFLFSIIFLRL